MRRSIRLLAANSVDVYSAIENDAIVAFVLPLVELLFDQLPKLFLKQGRTNITMRGQVALLLTFGALAGFAQTHSAVQPHTATVQKQLSVVAGIVAADGTVKYLPRVNIELMPKSYQAAEQKATAEYKSEIDALSAEREGKIRDLVEGRQKELAAARQKYGQDLADSLQAVSLTPAQALPSCVKATLILDQYDSCDGSYSIGDRLALSTPLQALLASPLIVGTFNPRTFTAGTTPAAMNLSNALNGIPFRSYLAVPEFSKFMALMLKKDSKLLKAKLGTDKITADTELPVDLASELTSQFVSSWIHNSEAYKSHELYADDAMKQSFGGISSTIVAFSLDQMEISAKSAIKTAREAPMKRYIADKDSIDVHYDNLQLQADSAMKAASEAAEKKRSDALAAVRELHPSLQQVTTSLQGQATILVPQTGGVLYAEDVTTDRHLRWEIAVVPAHLPKVLELTDANALVATPQEAASAAATPVFPHAATLSAMQLDEYDLRYGSRLLKTWRLVALSHDATVVQDQLAVTDSPLGFAFSVSSVSDNVYNTLRMKDNDIAVAYFKQLIAPYLQEVPNDLKSTGGSQAFEAVSMSVVGSKKDFSEEYAVGQTFTITYVFRLADVESFVAEKIDTQQLLDRGHISQDDIGRISVKYTPGQ
jgi:uncharacterized protein GlcG (DUF336 family)